MITNEEKKERKREATRRMARNRYVRARHDLPTRMALRRRSYLGKASSKGLPFDLDKEYLLELYNKQEGKCYYTGGKLDTHTFRTEPGMPDPFSLSLDRIIPERGYTKGNVVWCFNQVNVMKGVYDIETLYEWCRKLLEHSGSLKPIGDM